MLRAGSDTKMLLTLDISNSHITFGGASEGGDILFSSRMAAEKSRTADEYAVLMRLMLQPYLEAHGQPEECIVASVVPELTAAVCRAAQLVTGQKPMVVGPGVKTGLNIRLDDPSELGADFVAASVAAQSAYSLPVAAITMDTALGIGVIDGTGAYIGGVIAPGVMVSANALTRSASLLHDVLPQAPGHIICKRTDESLRSGTIYGAAAMLDGLLTGIDEELGEPVNAVATGRWAKSVIPHCRRPGIAIDPHLIHRGLWLIWDKNRKK